MEVTCKSAVWELWSTLGISLRLSQMPGEDRKSEMVCDSTDL